MTRMRASQTTLTEADGLPVPRRYWAIGGISLGITLAVIDSAIANVALPTIAADLNAEPAHSIWVVNGYQLAITVSLLPLCTSPKRRTTLIDTVTFGPQESGVSYGRLPDGGTNFFFFTPTKIPQATPVFIRVFVKFIKNIS